MTLQADEWEKIPLFNDDEKSAAALSLVSCKSRRIFL